MKTASLLACLGLLVLPGGAGRATDVPPTPDPDHTALHRAAERGDLAAARELLREQPRAQRAKLVNRPDRDGLDPLGYAARRGALEMVRLFVDSGARIDAPHGFSRRTALIEAAEQRHAGTVGYLLEQGADPNLATTRGLTPLAAALAGSAFQFGTAGDRDATIRALLARGADPALLLTAHDRSRPGDGVASATQRPDADEIRRLQAEVARLNALLKKIRSTAVDPGHDPNEKPR